MLIPSIDLMGGKIVQLVQGQKKALEFEDFTPWIERFSKYPLVQLIDLDAAMRQGSNRELLAMFAAKLPCQVGGGIHTIEAANELLSLGARAVIFGSALIKGGTICTDFAEEAARRLGPDKLVFAIDSRGGKVAIRGWTQSTEITPVQMMKALESYCARFLYTHIDTEGLLQGIPLDVVRGLRAATDRGLIVAGGVRGMAEVEALDTIGADAVVGMAIYTGVLEA